MTVHPFTVEDFLGTPDDGRRYELFDGNMLICPSPTPFHQQLAMRVLRALTTHEPAGYIALGPINLMADDENIFIPDLTLLDATQAHSDTLLIRPAQVLLVVEIVSRGTRKRDRLIKLEAYADAGIPYYWRVEPDEGPALYAYELADSGAYRLAQAAPAGQKTEFTRPFPITIDPAEWTR